MDHIEIVLKPPPDSTNSDMLGMIHEVPDNDSNSAGRSNNSVSTSPSISKSIPFRDPYLPDDDGSILTPEHAFVQYQTRSEDQACQICGQPAVGFHHRAYVCEACKKFFMRHTAARYRQMEVGGVNPSDMICPMGGQCRIEGPGRGKCPHCRYRKCLDLGMTLTPPGGESGCDISQIPCRVCGGPSSGFHFGALTCEGCKGFFRRTVLSNVRLECLSNNDCPITPANRNMCKSCRFQRCLAVGMSKSGSRIGRQPNAIKYYCAREISQISASSSDLDCVQPSSSVCAVSNGRTSGISGSRRRSTSASSEGEKARTPSSSWSALSCADRTVQPAHSSTDRSSVIHLPGHNGQYAPLDSSVTKPMAVSISNMIGPDDGVFYSNNSLNRFRHEGLQPPDSSPKNSGQKRRKAADRYDGTGCALTPGTADSPMPTSSSFSPLGDPVNDRFKFDSPQRSSYRESASQLHVVSTSRLGADWREPNSQSTIDNSSDRARRGYDIAMDALSRGSAPLEYSLPNPDTSTHISSTLPRLERRISASANENLPMSSASGTVLAPLSVHLSSSDPRLDDPSYKVLTAPGEMVLARHEALSPPVPPNFHPSNPFKEQSSTLLHHYPSQSQHYRSSQSLSDDSPPPVHLSPLPSSNLSIPVTTPSPAKLHTNEPDLTTAGSSRTTRSIVDHLTSTVLQFRHHQHRGIGSSSTSGSAPDSPASIGTRDYPNVTSRTVVSSALDIGPPRIPHYSRQSSSGHPSHGLTFPTSSTSPTLSAVSSGQPYPLLSSYKSGSPDLVWSGKQQQQNSTQQQQSHRFPVRRTSRSPPNDIHRRTVPGKYELPPVNGNSNVDVTSTSSASWFAAAAAAAAVANALMVASQAAPTSGMGDPYTAPSKTMSENPGRSAMEVDVVGSHSNTYRRTHTDASNYAKRVKMGLVESAHSGRVSPTPTGSDLESMYGLKLANCDSTGNAVLRSLHLPTPVPELHPASSASNLAAMRAAAAAAAAAAATAAGLVLSNSRVRSSLPSEDFSTHHRSPATGFASYQVSPGAASPTADSFVRAVVTSSMEALYGDRADQLFMGYIPDLGGSVRNPVDSVEPTPSVNLQVTGKEVSSSNQRSKNGVRTTFISVQEFAEGINTAAKYMISERKKIRNNLPQSCRPMHSLEHVEDIWSRMMQHFELHSRFIVHFVKLIPGFNQLELGDKRQLVRSAMYPLMLLELSRDYLNYEGSQYNYFDFTEHEREVILKHFPTFQTITGHLVRSGEFLNQVRLDNVELALVCAQEVFKNFHGLIDPGATEHLYHLAGRVLLDHIASSGKPLEERSSLLRHVSPLLEELNMEHHQVIAQLRQDKPQLDFPELYTEMFQLTESEESEHSSMVPTSKVD